MKIGQNHLWRESGGGGRGCSKNEAGGMDRDERNMTILYTAKKG